MCLGIPARIVGPVAGSEGWLVLADVEGVVRQINAGMLDEPPAPGQWVLLHLGFAVELIDEAAAEQALSGLELMGKPRQRENVVTDEMTEPADL